MAQTAPLPSRASTAFAAQTNSNTPSPLLVAAAWPRSRQALAAAREQGARVLLSADVGPNLRLPAAARPPAGYACVAIAGARPEPRQATCRKAPGAVDEDTLNRSCARLEFPAVHTLLCSSITCRHQGPSLTRGPWQRREHGPPRPCCARAAPPSSLTAAGSASTGACSTLGAVHPAAAAARAAALLLRALLPPPRCCCCRSGAARDAAPAGSCGPTALCQGCLAGGAKVCSFAAH